MKKLSLLILSILFTTLAFSQKTRVLRATVVLKSNDTIVANMRVMVDIFDNTEINELSFIDKIKLETEEGKLVLNESEINYMALKDFKGNQRTFVSDKFIPNFDKKNRLFELFVEGKLTWFCSYTPHLYNKSCVQHDYLAIDKKEPIEFGNNKKKKKKILSLILIDNNNLSNKLKNAKEDTDFMDILRSYNAQFEGKK